MYTRPPHTLSKIKAKQGILLFFSLYFLSLEYLRFSVSCDLKFDRFYIGNLERLSVKKGEADKKPVKKGKPAKDPNKPKRPASAFFVFMEDFRKQYKEKHPGNKSVPAVGKAVGDKWKSLSEAEKAPFVANAEKRKAEYNEHDQPVCRICDVVIKSESLWPAHQASRKHHEAIGKLKANAAAQNRPNNAKSESAKELPKQKLESSREPNDKSAPSTASCKSHSSTLPLDFFDNHDKKRQKNERDSGQFRDPNSNKKDSVSAKTQVAEAFVSGTGPERSSIAPSFQIRNIEVEGSKDSRQVSGTATGSEAKQVKGALPAGFFDDKDADLRARGIKPVKPDVKDEYKEFEKLIQEDLQEVDNRLEEEEFVAAEVIEEEETVEQRAYIERVEMLRRKKLELRASKSSHGAKDTEVSHKKSSYDTSSSDEDDDIKVDWRAKRL